MQQRRPGFPARLPSAAAPAPARPAPLAPQARHTAAAPPTGVGLDSAAVRARMVQKLAAGGITSAAVLQAMGAVERHRFVDSALVNQAYEDTSLPIGLQLQSPQMHEERLLRAANMFQHATDWHTRTCPLLSTSP